MLRVFLTFIISFQLFFFLDAQDLVELDAPESEDESICGAGYVTFQASSNINDPDLRFEWFEQTGAGLQFLGSLDGSSGTSQFISSFLIADKQYAVRVRIDNSVSPYTYVLAEILNEASVLQRPEIELCGQVDLESLTNMDSIASYQWQKLVPGELGQSFFEDLNTATSDQPILTAEETGFYRVIITDENGCQAISSEVEVTDDQVVQFIESKTHCYDPGIPSSDEVTLTSDYGRSFTQYFWEESLDSVSFTPIGTTRSIDVSKPTAQAYDTAFYRLTLTEQNCSHDTTIAVYWRPVPEGEISHINAGIGQSDFFFCGDDPEADRMLEATVTTNNTKVEWFSIDYSEILLQSEIKTYSGVNGPEDLLSLGTFFPDFLGEGDQIILNQEDGDRSMVDGGLVFAILTDTIANCYSYSNGIFADTSFPFPFLGNQLAYEYEPGMSSIPACEGEELVFSSYDLSADSYSWKEFDDGSGTFIEVGTGNTFTVTVNENYTGGTYLLEVTKNGCTSQSEVFEVSSADPPTVEITNFEEEAVACNEIPGVMLYGEGSSDASSYLWYYSPNDVNYTVAVGDSAKHFYFATVDGYYKLSAANSFCEAETEPVFVEIPSGTDPTFVEVALEGENEVCEGDEISIRSNYESSDAGYFWYFSYFQIDGDDISIELEERGGTTNPELVLDSYAFGSALTEPLTLYFYILVIDGDCVYGSTNEPHVVTINPSPNIEIVFSDIVGDEVFVCGDDAVIDQDVEVNNLSSVDLDGVTYLWTKYNAAIQDYDTIPGATTTNYTISSPGRYQCIASNEAGICHSMSNYLDVLVLPSEVAGDTTYCTGNDISLEAHQDFAADLSVFEYQWYYSQDNEDFSEITGAITSTLTIDPGSSFYSPGYFYYEASYNSCTTSSDVIEVRENDDSFNATLLVEPNQQKGVPFEATVSFNTELEDVTLIWEPAEYVTFAEGNRAIYNIPDTVSGDGSFIIVTISTESATCEVALSGFVIFEESTTVSFSKFVSPNGDGLNDTFRINGLDDERPNELKILDSWGNTLASFSNYYNGEEESDALVSQLKSEGMYYYLFSEGGNVLKGSFYLKK